LVSKELERKKAEAEKGLEITAELQEMVTSEASQLLMAPYIAEDGQKKTTDCSEASMLGNVATHTEPVIHELSDSSSSTSSSTSSSSFDSDDDKPLGQRYSTPFEPIFPTINRKIGEILELKSSRLPPNHPDQPQYIPPLNMILPDNVDIVSNLQTASEVAPKKVISESPQHQEPEPQKTLSPQHQPSA
jgi:hypothetical protein